MPTHRQATVFLAAAAAVVPVIATTLLVVLGGREHQSVAALLLAALVVGIAASGRRSAAVVAALAATVSYDYFLTTPYHSLAIHQWDDVLTVIALLVVGTTAALLRTRADQQRDRAEDGRNDIARIHGVAELVAEGRDPAYVVEVVRLELIDLMQLRGCTFDRDAPHGGMAQIERSGNVVIGELSWGVHQHGFPGADVELPVTALGVSVGRYVLHPTPGVPVSFDKRIAAVALADQVGAAFAVSLA